MIDRLKIESFKSLEKVEVELGQVNVFVGANGSGKSNLLEAIGVLSAAADGKVNDLVLLQRGVRPGVPKLYKSAFPSKASGGSAASTHIRFEARSGNAQYAVSLNNPLEDPNPAWRFKHELWQDGTRKLVGTSPAKRSADNLVATNPENGLAALRAVTLMGDDPALLLLKALQSYVIYSPTTPVLRGIAQENQPRSPLGLSGGQLPDAVRELMLSRADSPHAKTVVQEALELIDWAKGFASAQASSMPLSPAAAASPRVIKFTDRFMREGRNVLSGYDASEGALFILFLAVLAAHSRSPQLLAVDNADHGLNPRLAKSLISKFCGWVTDNPDKRQFLLTTHNPLVLDGLPLQDDRVRLFTVARTNTGRTVIRRIDIQNLAEKARGGWTLSRLWVAGDLGGVPNV